MYNDMVNGSSCKLVMLNIMSDGRVVLSGLHRCDNVVKMHSALRAWSRYQPFDPTSSARERRSSSSPYGIQAMIPNKRRPLHYPQQCRHTGMHTHVAHGAARISERAWAESVKNGLKPGVGGDVGHHRGEALEVVSGGCDTERSR